MVGEMVVKSYHLRDLERVGRRCGLVRVVAGWESLREGRLGPWRWQFWGRWWEKERRVRQAEPVVEAILEELGRRERWQRFCRFAQAVLLAGYDMFEFIAHHTPVGERTLRLGGVYLYQLDRSVG